MKPTTTWILIADGAHARIARNTGPGRGVEFLTGMEFHSPNLPGRGIMADRPGRTFDRAGLGPHAMEAPTDPRQHAKRRFAAMLASVLEDELKHDAYDRLIVVAPPKALGDLRAELPEFVRATVTGELNKDLTRVPEKDLPAHLAPVLAV
ncbi:MAG: host attachment protein [Alphaproteobacteria bacterium]